MGSIWSKREKNANEEFSERSMIHRSRSRELTDLMLKYLDNVLEEKPCPEVEPGFLKARIPKQPPTEPEPWSHVLHDVEHVILKGVSTAESGICDLERACIL